VTGGQLCWSFYTQIYFQIIQKAARFLCDSRVSCYVDDIVTAVLRLLFVGRPSLHSAAWLAGIWSWTTCCWTKTATSKSLTSACARRTSTTKTALERFAALLTTWHQRLVTHIIMSRPLKVALCHGTIYYYYYYFYAVFIIIIIIIIYSTDSFMMKLVGYIG